MKTSTAWLGIVMAPLLTLACTSGEPARIAPDGPANKVIAAKTVRPTTDIVRGGAGGGDAAPSGGASLASQ